MCLLALAWKVHPRWPVLLAANRDERHDRPSLQAHRWTDMPSVLGGRDVKFGGTWLGVSEAGRLASVTNFRSPADQGERRRSRGLLAREFLMGELDLEDVGSLDPQAFSPFNLILIEGDQAVFLTNWPQNELRTLPPGLYGLSNGQLDAPWPKTERLKARLLDWLQGSEEDLQVLFAALADETRSADADLPDTGVGLERERWLSASFIRGEVYGTRCSTVIRVGADGEGELVERSFGPAARPLGVAALSFRWSLKPTLL